jgi:hypothetical protein
VSYSAYRVFYKGERPRFEGRAGRPEEAFARFCSEPFTTTISALSSFIGIVYEVRHGRVTRTLVYKVI